MMPFRARTRCNSGVAYEHTQAHLLQAVLRVLLAFSGRREACTASFRYPRRWPCLMTARTSISSCQNMARNIRPENETAQDHEEALPKWPRRVPDSRHQVNARSNMRALLLDKLMCVSRQKVLTECPERASLLKTSAFFMNSHESG
jgi:hypothetical protein